MSGYALLAALCWPVVLAACLLQHRAAPVARVLAPWAALPALLVGMTGATDLGIPWLLLGGSLGLDAVARVLLPVTAALWLVAGLFAQDYLEAGMRRDRFFAWFLAALAGNLLLLAALDVVVFYLGFALMSFASYGLVVHDGDARARHAGRYYIAMVVVGEICVISGLMLLASRGAVGFAAMQAAVVAGDAGRNNLIIGLLIVGFGIKAGVFGLHFWLPLAHPVAPAPASAVLSGAMIKAGLVAWLRLLPLGDADLPGWGAVLAVLGLFTACFGVLAGLPQREAKTVLAYSSISQMGVMTLAVGLGLMFPAHWPVLFGTVLVYMVHHGLAKGGLFLGAGLVQHPLRPAAARLATGVLGLWALALAGGPLTGGYLAKHGLKHAAEDVAAPWGATVPALLTLSAVLTALLMLRFLWLAWPRASRIAPPAAMGLWAPWLALLGGCFTWPWIVAPPALRAGVAGVPALWGAAWPIALAAAVATGAVLLRRAGRIPALPRIPAGDLGIPLERSLVGLGRRLRRLANEDMPRALNGLRNLAGPLVRGGPAWSARFGCGEARIGVWSVTGLLVILLAVSLAWLLN